MPERKTRILGSDCTLLINFDNDLLGAAQTTLSLAGVNLGIPIGTIDSFKVTSQSKVHYSRPIGTCITTATPQYGGYEIEIGGFKDSGWRTIFFAILEELMKNHIPFDFRILQKIKYANNFPETFVYQPVTFYNLETIINSQSDFIQEPLKGFASERLLMGVDMSSLARSLASGDPFGLNALQNLLPK